MKRTDTDVASISKRPRIKLLQVVSILGFIAVLILNFLANYLPLNGKTTGELSDQYQNLFVPSGSTFSIWGVIYLSLLVYTIYQSKTLFSSKNNRINLIVGALGMGYFISSLANSFWIVAWHHEWLALSVAIMLVILLSLLYCQMGLVGIRDELTWKEKLLVEVPFGIYLGWICVATIANVTALLTSIQWERTLGESTWAIGMIVIGAIIAMFSTFQFKNGFIALAVVWAFYGILQKRLDSEPTYYTVGYVAGGAAVVLFITALRQIYISYARQTNQTMEKSVD